MTSPAVIPEIFYRESMFLLFLWFLNAFGPRLKNCRGDDEVGIHAFAFSLVFVFMLSSFPGVIRGQRPLIVYPHLTLSPQAL